MEGLTYIGVWKQYRSVEFATAEEVLTWAEKTKEATKEQNDKEEVQDEEVVEDHA